MSHRPREQVDPAALSPALRDYLHEHLPYRLMAVDGLRWFCERLLAGSSLRHVTLNLGGVRVRTPWLTNALADAGLVHARALCEFLGFCRGRRSGDLQSSRRDQAAKGDDVWVEDFGLARVSPRQACEVGLGSPEEVRLALLHLFETASKGVAHLTSGAKRAEVTKIHLATSAIWCLVVVQVYHAFGAEWKALGNDLHHQLSVMDKLPSPLERIRTRE